MRQLSTHLAMPLFALAVVVAVAACGFQPRGTGDALSVGAIPQPLLVVGLDRHSEMRRELLRQLDAADVAVIADGGGATATLRLSRQTSGRNLLSVDERNKALEYELSESVEIQLVDADGTVLIDGERLQARRIQYRPREDILAGTNEANLLRQDMYRDLARRVLIRIAAR